MKFPFGSMLFSTLKIIFTICVFSLIYQTTQISAQNARIPALFAFGDSILDTGNNNKLITICKSNFPPNGKDFPGEKATGRFGNGMVFTDLFAEGLGIKSLMPAYLDPTLNSTDFSTGVCFASGGSGVDELTAKINKVISMTDQINYFKECIGKLEGFVGKEKAKDIVSNSLILLSLGNNDIALTYYGFRLRKKYDIDAYTTLLVGWKSSRIKDLYGLGARRFAIMSTMPLGCLPGIRTVFGGIERRCPPNINQAATMFNSKLETEVNNLKRDLPDAKLVLMDVYNPVLKMVEQPQQSGFLVAAIGCCGSGRFETALACNKFTALTGCRGTSNHVFWDSAHPSERAYKIIVSELLSKYQDYF